jgi:DNA-binding NarL/FixJ family response regulator
VTRRVRVVVVDDHQLFRAGVRAELAGHFEIVGEAAGPAEAIAVIADTRPDVVLLDVHLPDGGGVAVLEALRVSSSSPFPSPADAASPADASSADAAPADDSAAPSPADAATRNPPRVLALSVSDAAEDVVPMIRAGALGYVTKTIDTAALVEAVERVAGGDAYFSPRLAAFVLQAFTTPSEPVAAAAADDPLRTLTPREREVLHHLARGYAYKRIALRLGISSRTVESHVGAVLRKLQLSSRHEISHWVASRGLIEEDGAPSDACP